ncbi:MAG: hypothetical protein Q7T54_03710 [Candidatus Levybacteria bacterium]|nr:hypothetical protein [Candidatus Levybacteria bacterium]
MARRTKFKYPRLTLLLVILLVTSFIFASEGELIHQLVTPLGFLGAAIAGFLYAFSFTAFAATGILLRLGGSENILFTGIAAGIGSVIGDLLILKVAKVSFEHEFKSLYKEPFAKAVIKPIPRPLQHFIKVLVAMIIIASPLPDEAGVALLANGYVLPRPIFSLMSFILNTTGILVILYAGRVL